MAHDLTPPMRVALQINMHPHDVRHVTQTLPHQLRQWRNQVDRIVLTIDMRQSASGRYRAADYEENRDRLLSYLESLAAEIPELVIDPVVYQGTVREAVERRFFGTPGLMPEKAFDGGPFYVYFFGLMRANCRYVLHMDSDMLFGGGSTTWIAEAIAALEANPQALAICPFPGPPRADGTLDPALHMGFPGLVAPSAPQRLELGSPAYRFDGVSTRIFMIDMARFDAEAAPLALTRPDWRRRLRSRVFGHQPVSMPAEEVLSANMRARGLFRIDMLGSGEGAFSLHPPYRSAEFYAALPGLIARIEADDIPDGQRGDYDVNASMVDWTSALREKARAKRYRKAFRQLLDVHLGRILPRGRP